MTQLYLYTQAAATWPTALSRVRMMVGGGIVKAGGWRRRPDPIPRPRPPPDLIPTLDPSPPFEPFGNGDRRPSSSIVAPAGGAIGSP
jgi:hypothetical protein